MKVLFTSHWYPSVEKPNQGIFIQKHYESIQQSDVDVTLLVIRIKHGKKILKRRIIEQPNNQIELVVESVLWKFLYLFYPLQRLFIWKYALNKIKKEKYDLVHANITHPNGVFGHYLSKRLGVPFIITEHHSQVEKYAHKAVTKNGFNSALKAAKYITSVSSFLKQKIKRINPSLETKIKVIGNVVDKAIFKKISNQKIEPNQFISVANWNSGSANTKLPFLICEALHHFSLRDRKQIVLNHVGNCNRKDELLAYETAYFKINFLGKKKPKEINHLLNSNACFLHATKFETFCVVGVEAQKAGCPVIISNINPINKILNHESVIFADNELDSWIEALNIFKTKSFSRQEIADFNNSKFGVKEIGMAFRKLYNVTQKK